MQLVMIDAFGRAPHRSILLVVLGALCHFHTILPPTAPSLQTLAGPSVWLCRVHLLVKQLANQTSKTMARQTLNNTCANNMKTTTSHCWSCPHLCHVLKATKLNSRSQGRDSKTSKLTLFQQDLSQEPLLQTRAHLLQPDSQVIFKMFPSEWWIETHDFSKIFIAAYARSGLREGRRVIHAKKLIMTWLPETTVTTMLT